MFGLIVIYSELINLFASDFQLFSCVDTIGNSFLIFSEEDVILNFDVLGFCETELGHTKIMFHSSKLRFKTIDFPHIVFDIMPGRRLLVKLTLGVLGSVRFKTALGIYPICFSRTAR